MFAVVNVDTYNIDADNDGLTNSHKVTTDVNDLNRIDSNYDGIIDADSMNYSISPAETNSVTFQRGPDDSGLIVTIEENTCKVCGYDRMLK